MVRRSSQREVGNLQPVDEESLLVAAESLLGAYHYYRRIYPSRLELYKHNFFTVLGIKVGELFDLVQSMGLSRPSIVVPRSRSVDMIRDLAGQLKHPFPVDSLCENQD